MSPFRVRFPDSALAYHPPHRATQPINRLIGSTSAFCFAHAPKQGRGVPRRTSHIKRFTNSFGLQTDPMIGFGAPFPLQCGATSTKASAQSASARPEIAKPVRVRGRVTAFTML